MTSRERILAAANGRPTDCIAVAPYMGNHGARVAGVAIDRYCRDGRLMAEAQLRAWGIYGQDAVVAQSDNYYIAEGFGARVQHHPDSTPTLEQPPLQALEQVNDLRVPNPEKHGRMPVYLDAIHRLSQRLGGEVAVRAPGTGPFSLASHLLGPETFLMELALADREPGGERERALRQLMDLTTAALIDFAQAALAAGADMVQAGDSLASLDMISPDMYRKWAQPWEAMFFRKIRPEAEARGAVTLLHICGDMTRALPDMADTGAHILELDSKVDLNVACRQVGDRVCLMGNLNPVDVLWRGSVEEVGQQAEQAIQDTADGSGFILGSGCEVPVAAPQQNISALIQTARKCGSSAQQPD